MEVDTVEEVARVPPLDSGDGIRFEQLCDDVILQVFSGLDYRQRTQSERITRRLGRLMPLITVDEDIQEFSDHLYGHCRRKTPETYLNIITRSPKIKNLQFNLLYDTSYLHEQTLKDFNYVSRYVETLTDISKSLTAFEIRNMIRCSNRSDLHLATAILKALGNTNQVKRIKLDIGIYNLFGHELELLVHDLIELVTSAPQLKTLELMCYGTEDDLEFATTAFRSRLREIKQEFTKFWEVVRKTVKNLDLKFSAADLFFGNQHWTMYKFEKLEKLDMGMGVEDVLTGGYIKNISENMPALKRLQIRTDKFCWISHLSKLTQLEDFQYDCYDENETDLVRKENCKDFHKFISSCGKKLRTLGLDIPHQRPEFLATINESCPGLKKVTLNIKGFHYRDGFSVSSVFVKNLRSFTCEARITVDGFKSLLTNCDKLRTIKFGFLHFDEEHREGYKSLIIDYGKRNARRAITVNLERLGDDSWHYPVARYFGNVTIELDNRCIPEDWGGEESQ